MSNTARVTELLAPPDAELNRLAAEATRYPVLHPETPTDTENPFFALHPGSGELRIYRLPGMPTMWRGTNYEASQVWNPSKRSTHAMLVANAVSLRTTAVVAETAIALILKLEVEGEDFPKALTVAAIAAWEAGRA